VNAFNSLEQGIKDSAPVHISRQYAEGNFLERAGTAEFWARDGYDALAFLASAYVPSTLTAKVGSATKLLNGMGQGKKLADVLTKVNTATGLNTQTALTTVYNTMSEAGAEGKEAFDTLKEEYAKTAGFNSFASAPPEVQEQLKMKAGEGAARVYNWNLIALTAPNFLQSKIFHGASKDQVKTLRDQTRREGKSASELYKANAESYLKNFGMGIASEGLWEENIQSAVQSWEKRVASGNAKEYGSVSGPLVQAGKNAANFVKAMTTLGGYAAPAGSAEDEAASAIMLGGMIGGGMGLMKTRWDNEKLKTNVNQFEKQWNTLKGQNEVSKNLMTEDFGHDFKTFGVTDLPDGTKTPQFLNTNGELERDPAKVNEAVIATLTNNKLVNEFYLAMSKGDVVHADFSKKMMLAAHIHRLASRGLSKEDLQDLIQYDGVINGETAKQLGIEGFIKENPDLANQFIEDYYDDSSRMTRDQISDDAVSKKFVPFLRRNRFYTKAKLASLEGVQGEQADLLRQEATELLSSIDDGKNYEAFKKAFEKEMMPTFSLLNEGLKLDAKTDKTIEEESRRKDIDYLLLEEAATKGTSEINYPPDLGIGISAISNSFPSYEARESAVVRSTKSILKETGRIVGQAALDNALLEQALDPTNGNIMLGELSNEELQNLNPAFEADSNIRVRLAEEAKNTLKEVDRLKSQISDLNIFRSNLTVNPQVTVENIAEFGLAEEAEGLGLDNFFDAADPENVVFDLDRIQEAIDETNAMILEMSQRESTIKDLISRGVKNDATVTDAAGAIDADKLPLLFATQYLAPVQLFLENHDPNTSIRQEEAQMLAARIYRVGRVTANRTDMNDRDKEIISDLVENYSERMANALADIENNLNKRGAIQITAHTMESQMLESVVTQMLKNSPNEEVSRVIAELRLKFPYSFMGNLFTLIHLIKKGAFDIPTLVANTRNSTVKLIQAKPINFPPPAKVFNNPRKYGPYILRASVVGSEHYFANDGNILFEYERDKSLSKLIFNLEQNPDNFPPELLERLKEVANHLVTLQAADDIARIGASNITAESFAALTEVIDAYIAKAQIIPSAQQLVAITEALISLTSASQEDIVQATTIIKGVLGSGKTSLVASLVVQAMSKLNKDMKVLAVAYNKEGSEGAARHTSKEDGKTLAEFLAMDDDKVAGYSLIVIDEAMAPTNQELLGAMNKIDKINKAKKLSIKILAIGDPSQQTAEAKITLLLGSFSNPETKDTSSVSVIYRTSVNSVANAALSFKDKQSVVPGINTVASHAAEELVAMPTTDGFFGVVSAPLNALDTILSKPSSRTRMVIVNTPQEVAALRARYSDPNLKILTHYEAQAPQAQEVYILLRKDKGNAFGKVFPEQMDYNSTMYTAIGRAQEAVVLFNPDFRVETSITDVGANAKENLTEDTANNLRIWNDERESLKFALKELAGITVAAAAPTPVPTANAQGEVIVPPPTPTATAEDETEDEVVEIVEPPSPNTEPEIQEPTKIDTPEGEESIQLRHPSFKINLNGQVKPGSEAWIVPVKSPRNNKGFSHEYYVIAPMYETVWLSDTEFEQRPVYDGENRKWITVGILGEEDIANSPTLSKLSPNPDAVTDTRNIIINDTDNGFAMNHLVESKVVKKLQLSQSNNIGVKYQSYLEPGVNRSLHDTFLGIAKSLDLPLSDNIEADMAKYSRVIIYSNKSKKDYMRTVDRVMNTSGKRPFEPRVGIPYMVVSSGKGSGSVFVQLEPDVMTPDHPYIETISKATDIFLKLENFFTNVIQPETPIKLGTVIFNDFMKEYSKVLGIEKEGDKRNVTQAPAVGLVIEAAKKAGINLDERQAFMLASIIPKEMLNVIYHVEPGPVRFTAKEADEFIKDNPRFEGGGKQSIYAHNKGFAEEMDHRGEGGAKHYVIVDKDGNIYEDFKVSYSKSPLQVAINAVARANDNVPNIAIRTRRNKVITGISLFADNAADGHYWSALREALISDIVPEVLAILNRVRTPVEAEDLYLDLAKTKAAGRPVKLPTNLIIKRMMERLSSEVKGKQVAEEDYVDIDQKIKQLEESLFKSEATPKINTETLVNLATSTKLRTPLHRDEVNFSGSNMSHVAKGTNIKGIDRLSSLMHSRLQKVTPTTVGLSTIPSEPAKPKVVTPIRKNYDKNNLTQVDPTLYSGSISIAKPIVDNAKIDDIERRRQEELSKVGNELIPEEIQDFFEIGYDNDTKKVTFDYVPIEGKSLKTILTE